MLACPCRAARRPPGAARADAFRACGRAGSTEQRAAALRRGETPTRDRRDRSEHPIDPSIGYLVIPAGAHALRFALKHRASLFPGVPIVFCAVDEPSVAGLELGPDVTGVWMFVDWSATLDVALRLQPDTRRVIVVQGTSDLDRRLAAQAREAFSTYQGRVEFTYLIGLPMEQLLKEVAALPDRTVVVFGSLLREGAGRTFVPMEALSLIARTSRAPIYGVFDTLVGGGIVGGSVCSSMGVSIEGAR